MTLVLARLLARVGDAMVLIATVPPGDPLGPVTGDPDAIRDTACRLVESSDVCAPPPPPPTFDPASGGGGSGGGAGGSLLGALLWVLLIAIAVALVFVAVRYVADRTRRRTDQDDDAETEESTEARIGPVAVDRSREPAGWRLEADEHRANGRWRDALRCRYRALVGDLARRGLIDEVPGRTTGEERRQMRIVAPEALPSFGEAADMFDAAWFGRVPVGEADDDRFRQLDAEVLARTGAGVSR
jgi:hypothetical protein